MFSAFSLDDGRAYAIKSAPILHELGENKYHEVERWEPLSDLNIVQYVKAWEEKVKISLKTNCLLNNICVTAELEQDRTNRLITDWVHVDWVHTDWVHTDWVQVDWVH